MKITETSIHGVYLLDLDVYEDARGFFLESYHRKKYSELGLDVDFVQDNRSFSQNGIVRGLHYQVRRPIGQLIYVAHGSVFDVGVDLRADSPTFGKHVSVTLSSEKHQQLFLPAGVAHGFCTLGERNEILYKCTEYYDPNDEAGLLWNDTDLGIKWPIKDPVIKDRDASYPKLKNIRPEKLPAVNR